MQRFIQGKVDMSSFKIKEIHGNGYEGWARVIAFPVK
ncbi:hypothetical protein FHX95_002065 [Clostridium saccharobutylicum]|nr:hypothetical protein [Clostridium saccharobutylicum]